ncbi:MAG TPA: toll/interleukin-1 receptor domain-containing protein [Vicinamibacterales bacterium]|jgi:hypothetical protein
MYVFLSYSSARRATAEDVAGALKDENHDVFFDRTSLRQGFGFHRTIREAVRRSDAFVCLVSQESVKSGSYVLTEIGFAEERWPRPNGFVLPVILEAVPRESMPPYLTRVTWLTPKGSVAAEVAAAVEQLNTPDKLPHDEQRRWTEDAAQKTEAIQSYASWTSLLTTIGAAIVTVLLAAGLVVGAGRSIAEVLALSACLVIALGFWLGKQWLDRVDRRDRLRALELFAQLKTLGQADKLNDEQRSIVDREFKRWQYRLV